MNNDSMIDGIEKNNENGVENNNQRNELQHRKLQQEIEKGDLEILKLRNENAKIEAERQKIETEREKLQTNWFFRDLTLETVGKIVLGAGVMAFSYGLFIQPYFAGREEVLRNKNEKIQDRQEMLAKLNDSLNTEKAALKHENAVLDSNSAILANGLKYQALEKIRLDKELARGNTALMHMNDKYKAQSLQYSKLDDSIAMQKQRIRMVRENMKLIPEVQKLFLNLRKSLESLDSVRKIQRKYAVDFSFHRLVELYPDSMTIANACKWDIARCLNPLELLCNRLHIPKVDLEIFSYDVLCHYSLTELGLNTKTIYKQAFDNYMKNKEASNGRAVLMDVNTFEKYAEITSQSFMTTTGGYSLDERYFRIPFTGNVTVIMEPLINKMENYVLDILLSR